MNASVQTILALAVVAVAAALLLWHFFIRKKPPGCAGNCGAVSPEVRKLRDQLRH